MKVFCWTRIVLLPLFVFLFSAVRADQSTNALVELALRKTAHELLLQHGDSSSRVLPVVHEGDAFRVPFEAEFSFSPDSLVELVHRNFDALGVLGGVIIEMQNCETGETAYSFGINLQDMFQGDPPCLGRQQPKGCYVLALIIPSQLPPLYTLEVNESSISANNPVWDFFKYGLIAFLVAFLVVFLVTKKKPKGKEAIELGSYQFYPKQMVLVFQKEQLQLSGIEAKLLEVLVAEKGETLEKEVLLEKVWGNNEGYVGRTLDVTISKLRKLLEKDASLKIVNIRGVGYKLIEDLD